MITAGEFRKGITFVMDDKVFNIIDFMHVKPGKGAAFVRTKIKNAMTGQVLERTFNPNEKFELAQIERKEMQYLYNEGELYHFMNNTTYEQDVYNKDALESALNYIVEGMTLTIYLYKGKAFNVEPPIFVDLEIVECEPGVQGDTSKSGNKPAILETGCKIQVPLFVNNHERIKVDTRTCEYVERV